MSDKPDRIPVDFEQCQAMIQQGSFMTLGPREWKRCKNPPSFISKENKPGADGVRGAMSVCEGCLKVLKRQMEIGILPPDSVSIFPIREWSGI